jgi:hypothetical protein
MQIVYSGETQGHAVPEIPMLGLLPEPTKAERAASVAAWEEEDLEFQRWLPSYRHASEAAVSHA